MSKTTELLQNQFEKLQKKYEEVLPKVDAKLINDLLLRQMENPRSASPIYMGRNILGARHRHSESKRYNIARNWYGSCSI